MWCLYVWVSKKSKSLLYCVTVGLKDFIIYDCDEQMICFGHGSIK